MNKEATLLDSPTTKCLISSDYNYVFKKDSGLFIRWGKTKDDDPVMSPFGPEIVDIEISTCCSQGCKHCYKSNEPGIGKNMTLETYRDLLSKLPKCVTQVALGIGDIDGNKDLYGILEHSRMNSVIPNITINGYRMCDSDYDKLAEYCGAVAVSYYDKDICFDAVEKLIKRSVQTNIHALFCEETYEKCMDIMRCKDERLKGIHAIVFLALKPKGRGSNYTRITNKEKLVDLLDLAWHNNISIGFDSCMAHNYMNSRTGSDARMDDMQLIEPCESCLFSMYINVDGIAYPCSFAEQGEGVDILTSPNFLEDVWKSKAFKNFRLMLYDTNRECPIYNLDMR